LSDNWSDITTTLREFQRNFGRMRAVAAAGKVVHIKDLKTGEDYVFKATKLTSPKPSANWPRITVAGWTLALASFHGTRST